MNGIDAPQVGDRIRIVRMEGEPRYDGKEGTITHVDDMGQLHGTWGGCTECAAEMIERENRDFALQAERQRNRRHFASAALPRRCKSPSCRARQTSARKATPTKGNKWSTKELQ